MSEQLQVALPSSFGALVLLSQGTGGVRLLRTAHFCTFFTRCEAPFFRKIQPLDSVVALLTRDTRARVQDPSVLLTAEAQLLGGGQRGRGGMVR